MLAIITLQLVSEQLSQLRNPQSVIEKIQLALPDSTEGERQLLGQPGWHTGATLQGITGTGMLITVAVILVSSPES